MTPLQKIAHNIAEAFNDQNHKGVLRLRLFTPEEEKAQGASRFSRLLLHIDTQKDPYVNPLDWQVFHLKNRGDDLTAAIEKIAAVFDHTVQANNNRTLWTFFPPRTK